MAEGRSGLGQARVVDPTSGLRGPRLRRRPGPVAVIGPGLIAGLSDDDPAGITTYSVLGLVTAISLWVLIDPDTRACIDRGTTEGNSTPRREAMPQTYGRSMLFPAPTTGEIPRTVQKAA